MFRPLHFSVAEGFLERSDLSKLLDDSYNSGYSDGKRDGAGVGGIRANSQGMQYANQSINWTMGYRGTVCYRVYDFPWPSNEGDYPFTRGINAAILHIATARLYFSSTNGHSFEIGYWLDNGTTRRTVTVKNLSFVADGSSFNLGPAAVMIPYGSFDGPYFCVQTYLNGSETKSIVGSLSLSFQWFVFE